MCNRDLDWNDQRLAAQSELARIGKPAVPSLIKLLDFDPRADFAYENAFFAAEALGAIGQKAKAAIPKLSPLLYDHSARHVLAGEYLDGVAAKALGQIGAPAIPVLKASLHDPDWRTRVVILLAFRTMGAGAHEAFADLLAMLKDPNPNVRGAASDVFGAMGPLAEKAIPDLVGLLGDKVSGDQEGPYGGGPVYKEVMMNLARIGQPAIKAALTHSDPEVRSLAQAWLVDLQKKESR